MLRLGTEKKSINIVFVQPFRSKKSIQKLYEILMRKTAQTALLKVIYDIFICTFDKHKCNTSNKKRTGRNHSQF